MNAGNLTNLKLVQVSDCHVSSDPDTQYRGLKPGQALRSLLPSIRAFQPDLVLLTGDASEDGSARSYGRVSALLDSIGAPVLALPGNHDIPAVMKRYFPDGPWHGPLFRGARGWQLILLDSTGPEEIAGVFPDSRRAELEKGLAGCGSDHILVALHHQPVEVGSPWIDKYALRDAGPLVRLLENEGRVRCVTWGHVHQDYSAKIGETVLLGAPSTVANSLPGRRKFTLDLSGPACRWLVLGPGGEVDTGLLRP